MKEKANYPNKKKNKNNKNKIDHFLAFRRKATMREHDFFLTIHKLVIYHILKEIDYISLTPLNKQGTIFSQCYLVVGDYPVGEC